jgi:exonuclease III
LNVCGISKRLQYPEFDEFVKRFDIIGLQETKVDDSDNLQLPGFTVFTKNRSTLSKVRSGGIALAVKDSISKHFTLVDNTCKYVMWFRISRYLLEKEDDIFLGIVYIPPENSKYTSPDCFSEIERVLISLANDCKYICLMGDFNAKIGNLKNDPTYTSNICVQSFVGQEAGSYLNIKN